MSLASQVSTALVRVGTEFKTLRGEIASKLGDVSTLTTSNKTVYGAIAELKTATAAAAGVDDTAASSAKAYSSSKTESVISNAIAQMRSDLVNGAPAALDTLKEVADQLALDQTGFSTLTNSVAKRVSVDASQGLTTIQQGNARANILAVSTTEVGDPTTDFVAQFVASLA